MKLCEETITVYNARLNQDTGDTVLHGTVISGVSWFEEVAAAIDPDRGLKAASKITVRIPEEANTSGKKYVRPKSYQGSDPDRFFTLESGDILVKGGELETGLTISDLQKRHGRLVTVLAVTNNNRAPRARHWKLVGA